MKRKVAIFANGWSNEYLELVLEGIRRRADKERVDLFVFVNFSSGAETKPDNLGEKSIFTLPDLKSFDGVILAANTFNLVSERDYLTETILRTKVPAVSLEYELSGIPYLGTDNYKGIYRVVEHVIQEHKAREFLFVSGPHDNSESRIRMQAMKDALQAAGIELSENRIIEAGWSYYAAYEQIMKWLNANEDIPDAIICANDEMAIGVCTALEAMGIEVPGRTIVTGCDTLAIPYLQKCQREGKTSAIVFADVNRMKMINDKYGHLQGDLALCTVAEAIKKTLPKDWIAVRYGGDEFIMVGACEDMAEAEALRSIWQPLWRK